MDVDKALSSYEQQREYPLCRLFNEVDCDKGPKYHYYSRFYQMLFEPIQQESFALFEMGIGTNDVSVPCNLGASAQQGTSLRAWERFFPNSHIYAADIDSKTLFQAERIQTFQCDQTKKESIQAMWNSDKLREKKFKIIIDDGLHEVQACKTFFENSIHKLEKGGVFIVEDIFAKLGSEVITFHLIP